MSLFLSVAFVNPVTGMFVSAEFPQIHTPPSARNGTLNTFAFNEHAYSPSYGHDEAIIGDYGFIFLVPEREKMRVLIFGNWSHGTELGVRFLVSRDAKTSSAPCAGIVRRR